MQKDALDDLLERYKVQPVGWGYIDCITLMEHACAFVEALTTLGIRITDVTWWCHCANWMEHGVNEETGCPHGGGGPKSKYFEGCFSEMYQIPNMKFPNNHEVLWFFVHQWPIHKNYLPCLVPAFWLDVPNVWRNRDNPE